VSPCSHMTLYRPTNVMNDLVWGKKISTEVGNTHTILIVELIIKLSNY